MLSWREERLCCHGEKKDCVVMERIKIVLYHGEKKDCVLRKNKSSIMSSSSSESPFLSSTVTAADTATVCLCESLEHELSMCTGRTCGDGEQRRELREAAMSSRDGQLGREKER